ncbi:hypothetical protein [Maridesulfovibrio salexigens]|uniref:Uncharacterized protein n=1 Tax=Maridesulfovibrio salexigens (strain ATCC 14822 / DSM 2638 / NCIMB 8403 / VKM B-1763) TaxID=526222 RepID=C6BRN3_MARSD|nr:hypothetical protein [Maridesulfovibrio salexigens]ACS79473.1 hypothetical protein Desal_1411 [Maridesulfovibrio salexigens DSM 2638]
MAKLRNLAPVFIFISSYLPLALILVVKNFDSTKYQSLLSWHELYSLLSSNFWGNFDLLEFSLPVKNPLLVCFIIFTPAVSLLILCWILNEIERCTGVEIKIDQTKTLPTDIANYSVPYIAAFFSLDIGNKLEIISLLIFLTTMFAISYKSGAIFFNPMMIILGYKYMQATYEDNSITVTDNILSKHKIEINEKAYAVNVSGILFITQKDN